MIVKENDVYIRERQVEFTLAETITFKNMTKVYNKHEYDWYMTVALEKSDLVMNDRHLLTSELLLSYRWAIREGYQHNLDKTLTKPYTYPRNQNTINGIKGYIQKIEKLSQAEMNGD